MTRFISRKLQKSIVVALIVCAFAGGSYCLAQMGEDGASNEAVARPTYAMSENELANLVAPIALYPDGLLGEVLVACTYPDEVVEAQWWLEQNGNLPAARLMEGARQQNWDPSVQMLVAFPDVVGLLNRDLRWTTELGNAFLAQQADVMNAIQNLRADARGNGQLADTDQLSVNTEMQGNRGAIEIQPADAQNMFVPNYDPNAVWGAPAEGTYPSLPYAEGNGFDALSGTVANLAGLLPGFTGLLAPNTWGWALNWLSQALVVNNAFFSDFGFHNYGGGSRGTSLWVHNGDRSFGGRYGNNSLAGWQGRGNMGGEGWRNFGNSEGRGVGGRDSFAQSGNRAVRSGDPRAVRGGDWRRFNVTGRAESSRGFGRQGTQLSRTADRGQRRDYRSGGNSYFANSRYDRSESFRGSSAFDSRTRYNEFGNSGSARRQESSGMRTGSRSWNRRGKEPHYSAARMSSARSSSFGREKSSRNESSWKRGFSSHGSKQKAPKYKAPHYAKSHGGGHSSKGHSEKRSHHG
ncbi:MAG: hypothetical protein JWQ87_3336 [Candidatus Sulfotelmatobacter sp.]|nr:hypothetical protein [Candidatus Sulfotelmatobacter sp.]